MTKTYEEFIPFRLDTATGRHFREMDLLGENTVELGPPHAPAINPEDDTRGLSAGEKRENPDASP